jgi:predicted DNA-binding transcriptional regulator AlpA
MTKELNESEKIALLGVKQVLTSEDVVLFTGLSKSTLHKLTSAKKIPYYKSRGGKINYYDKNEITKWMLDTRIKTSDEVEEEALAYISENR